ncbi:MAG: acylphosphatase [Proteobacteria bacterium]|nr:acylphosphatase [Pseudomonadota bacterium]MDA1059518.1 acylphosphatase [Pseudomonadota bacterium]
MSPDAPELITLRVRISGNVQGVWYRGWSIETARALGLSGWVRNRADGTVEALLHGPETVVRDMVDACRKGPSGARVADVTVEPAEAKGDDVAGGFTQRPTV